jgi:bifunctional non-homologous end joining protein LigD
MDLETIGAAKALSREDEAAGQKVSGMLLADYRRKRPFTETPEPVGGVRQHGRRRIFVVQKHDASRLHYDFRLAIRGVLVSTLLP